MQNNNEDEVKKLRLKMEVLNDLICNLKDDSDSYPEYSFYEIRRFLAYNRVDCHKELMNATKVSTIVKDVGSHKDLIQIMENRIAIQDKTNNEILEIVNIGDTIVDYEDGRQDIIHVKNTKDEL